MPDFVRRYSHDSTSFHDGMNFLKSATSRGSTAYHGNMRILISIGALIWPTYSAKLLTASTSVPPRYTANRGICSMLMEDNSIHDADALKIFRRSARHNAVKNQAIPLFTE
jgi:hypothetical protein